MSTLLQDIKFGVRMLAKNPAFTAVAVLTLALGIGANLAVFNLCNAVLWRALPVKDAASLVVLQGIRKDGRDANALPARVADELRRGSDVFSDVIARADDGLTFSFNGGGAERVVGEVVTPNFFTVLGISPALGQGFSAGVQQGHWAPEAVLSYRFWQRRFGGDPGVLGRTIRLNDYPFTIVGVSPANFYSLVVGFDPELRVPLLPSGQTVAQSELLSNRYLNIMARRKPGVTLAQADASTDAICRQVLRDDSDNQHHFDPIRRVRLLPGEHGWQGSLTQYRTALLVLIGLAGLVLLVGSFNLASMLMARATTRWRELAVRTALGASRVRLIRQMLTESALLAASGGAAGYAMMSWTGKGLLGFLPTGHINVVLDLTPDARTVWFSVALTVLVGLAFGLLPAIQATKPEPTPRLKADSAGAIGDAAGARFRQALAAAQIALSLVLLVAAGLLERSLGNLRAADPFPQSDRVLLFRLKPQQELYDSERIRRLCAEVVRRISALPGVESAALAEEGPFGSRGALRAHVRTPDGRMVDADLDMVTPDYFATLGVPILAGRDFTPLDKQGSKPVVVINDLLAHSLFGAENPLGKTIVAPLQSQDVPFEIVGVVRATAYYDAHMPAAPGYFCSLQQWGPYMPTLHVRVGSASRETVMAEVRREFEAIDSNVPVFDIKTLRDRLSDALAQQRLVGELAEAFGALALALVMVGLYGLMSFSVARRTREIGIRLALGAEPWEVMGLVARQGLSIVAIGLAVGLPASLLLARVLTRMLYGVRADDPLTFMAVALLLGLVAAVAGYLPARRAAHIDPMVALRHE